MTPPARIRCAVPHCTRTCRADQGFDEWVCSDHWRAVSKPLRRLYAASKRKFRRDHSRKNWARISRVWAKCRDAAKSGGFLE